MTVPTSHIPTGGRLGTRKSGKELNPNHELDHDQETHNLNHEHPEPYSYMGALSISVSVWINCIINYLSSYCWVNY